MCRALFDKAEETGVGGSESTGGFTRWVGGGGGGRGPERVTGGLKISLRRVEGKGLGADHRKENRALVCGYAINRGMRENQLSAGRTGKN